MSFFPPRTSEVCWSGLSWLCLCGPVGEHSVCVCVCVWLTQPVLPRWKGIIKAKNQRRNYNGMGGGICLHCKNIPASWFARAICSYVCLKPVEYAVETTAEDHSPTPAPVSSKESRPPHPLKSRLQPGVSKKFLSSLNRHVDTVVLDKWIYSVCPSKTRVLKHIQTFLAWLKSH